MAGRSPLTHTVPRGSARRLVAMSAGGLLAVAATVWVLVAAVRGATWTGAFVAVAIVVALAHELRGDRLEGPHARLIARSRGALLALGLAVAIARIIGLVL